MPRAQKWCPTETPRKNLSHSIIIHRLCFGIQSIRDLCGLQQAATPLNVVKRFDVLVSHRDGTAPRRG
jgi:hypothetical protein